ncbi:MAG: transcription-repair coupling factor [Pseudomonadota bacterium]
MPTLLSVALPREHNSQAHLFGGLAGASRALFCAEVARRLERPVLVVTTDQQAADLTEADIRAFSGNDTPILHFPDWETLPYDRFSPHQDIISERLRVLSQLPSLERGVVVVAAASLLQRLPPQDYVESRSIKLKSGQSLQRDSFIARLIEVGYVRVPEVNEHGEIAIRGSIIDLYPMGTDLPLRIDFFDDDIESLTHFDPDTQISGAPVEHIDILPAREVPMDADAIAAFRGRYRDRFEGQASKAAVYRDVSEGIAHGGIEYYLPLFFATTSRLLDYLPSQTLIIADTQTQSQLQAMNEQIQARFEVANLDAEQPVLNPDEAFFSPADIESQLHKFLNYAVQTEKPVIGVNVGAKALPLLAAKGLQATASESSRKILNGPSKRILFTAESAGRREALAEFLSDLDARPVRFESLQEFFTADARLGISIAPFGEGFALADDSLLVLPEQAVFGQRVRSRKKRRRGARDPQALISELSDLRPGAPVVHEEYGVGRYLELSSLDIGGVSSEYVTLEYAGGDKLYVPVHALHRISRYTGASAEHAPMHRLGTDQWDKARKKAAQKARDVAVELLDVYARRAARKGHRFKFSEANYRAFESSFPYEATQDQQQVIDDVLTDMRSGSPMDRVVCGDVGFGKTEVALRAAFAAIEGGKQVAMLVPTTLLAQQHFETFRDRFADWPFKVEVISRFRSSKQLTEVLSGLRSGSVDVVIGTHKLLQHKADFKDIGLIIVDEEHRFGVRQKEAIKSLRSEVDILTLTATPIPRTLNMALGGLRELSLITTPPSERLSIKTFVTQWNDALIREAALREIRRGGQVYFVHNKVADIDNIRVKLEKLIPEARIEIGHGQMPETQLEQVMVDFYHRRFNLLLCTTIIESGIDVPSANTIIINHADRFGLAQLHQMRGRVGRSHHRAYAYLLAPPKAAMSADAQKRLQAIDSLEDLGAGFALASHDLEIRGAGELLGDGQSGQIQEIGFSLYTELLSQAVQSLRNGKEPDFDKPLNTGTEVNVHEPALLPEDYVPDIHLRLVLYKRIANAANDAALRELKVELIDRFGLLPDPASTLFDVTAIKLAANRLGIEKIDASASGGYLVFGPNTPVDPGALIQLVQSNSSFKMRGAERLAFSLNDASLAQRLGVVAAMLARLDSGIDASELAS